MEVGGWGVGAHAPNFQHILYSSQHPSPKRGKQMDASDIWLFLTLSCHSFCLVLISLLAAHFVELHLSSKTYFATFSLETSCS